MIPVVTPEQMRRIDAGAVEPLEVLIERAGWAVASAARRILGGTYGRRIAVLVGKGNNGADGRVAARVLERWGARCEVHGADALPASFPANRQHPIDLVVDACYGTGFRGTFHAPSTDAPVLAVDIPSGVDGLTGAVSGVPFRAIETVTFVAPKPGLFLHPGAEFVGNVTVADIGLRVPASENVNRFLLDEGEAAVAWPRRSGTAHKWRSAVWVIGGSAGLEGAPRLAALGAARAGAGYVRLSIPGLERAASSLMEVVGHPIGLEWADEVLRDAGRFGALVLGPGLATDERQREQVAVAVERWPGTVVVDAGGLHALGVVGEGRSVWASRTIPPVLTPHDGEFVRMGGRLADRLDSVESMAVASSAVVLLKGPTTLIASPDGSTILSTSGDARLATAGSGDVLSGVIGAALALGLEPARAAALATSVHGLAARRGPEVGLMAGDLPGLVSAVLSDAS
ncbi:MAG: NAD(P)H-hydrate dehydratase [Actinomycetota bacterium]|nr:NAD(P)H-hydrate dehydratase [Actinomycetota bacterium]